MDAESILFDALNEQRKGCIRYLVSRGAGCDDAQDCFQQALYQLLQRFRQKAGDLGENPQALLYDIAYKRFKDLLRNGNSGHQGLDTLPVSHQIAPAAYGEEDDVVTAAASMRALFQRFDPRRGDLLYYRYVESRSADWIATQSNMTSGSVVATLSMLKTRFETWVQNQPLSVMEEIRDLLERHARDGRWPWERQ